MSIPAEAYQLLKVKELKEHEQINRKHHVKIIKEIQKNRYVIPIIVDSKHKIILDGHHRFNAIKRLGYKDIPAVIVDYESSDVQVASWRNNIIVTKSDVIRRGLNKDLYPPKTSRHTIRNLPQIRIPLKLLEVTNE